jgi:hypothetical protein
MHALQLPRGIAEGARQRGGIVDREPFILKLGNPDHHDLKNLRKWLSLKISSRNRISIATAMWQVNAFDPSWTLCYALFRNGFFVLSAQGGR